MPPAVSPKLQAGVCIRGSIHAAKAGQVSPPTPNGGCGTVSFQKAECLGCCGNESKLPGYKAELFPPEWEDSSRKRGVISVVLLSAISIQTQSSIDYKVIVEDVTGCLMFLSFPSHAFASSASGCVCRLGSCCQAGCSEGLLSCNSVQGTSMAPAPSCYQLRGTLPAAKWSWGLMRGGRWSTLSPLRAPIKRRGGLASMPRTRTRFV